MSGRLSFEGCLSRVAGGFTGRFLNENMCGDVGALRKACTRRARW